MTEVSGDAIRELRSSFLKKLEAENKTEGFFAEVDVARVKADDEWLGRFLLHHEMVQDDALSMLWETLEWRKQNRVNEINDLVNYDYLKEGAQFPHNFDRDGKALFIFRCKLHSKGQKSFDDLKMCLIYWFERLEKEHKGNQITIVFDMQDSGLSNLDMDYTKYLINLCKSYYPYFLNYILIFEMPWILNAAFKIIKSWLPEKAVQKIKFVNQKTLGEYVEPSQALKSWGGEDPYEFSFEPEPAPVAIKIDKKVTFNDLSPIISSQGSTDMNVSNESQSSLINITPADAVIFKYDATNSEYVGQIHISNISNDKNVSFKIKTTSPEKFRVHPSISILGVEGMVAITVTVLPDFTPNQIMKEKFLIMCLPVESIDLDSIALSALWKAANTKNAENYRLRCAVECDETDPYVGSNNYATSSATNVRFRMNGAAPVDVNEKIDKLFTMITRLNECNGKLHQDLQNNQRLSIITLALLAVIAGIMIYMYMHSNAIAIGGSKKF
ncbi:unnamed protein product [Bemisia tabaci]|uniref:Motile sperm domain-containing protein 2 n=1 Tax=Bemisia tabaci TaxID=7038 RepID=A0A9P0A3G6_BEMTA|nr:unnamed protein product [Bemisia tabaci]